MIEHILIHGYQQQEVAFMGKHSAVLPNFIIFYNNVQCNTEKRLVYFRIIFKLSIVL